MKILKKIFIFLFVIIVVILVSALFIKKNFKVEKEIVINKSNSNVFNYIKFIKNQDYYSKWSMMDPNMKKFYKGSDGTVGFISAWKSKNEDVGEGEQEILRIIEGKSIYLKIRFKKPFESQNDAYLTTDSLDLNKTNVKWGFKGYFPYPMNIFTLFFDIEKTVGEDLQIGLNNLKVLLESK